MDDRGILRHAVPTEQIVLEVVLFVKDDNRHRGQVGRLTSPPAVRQGGGGGGEVAERAERVDAAALHRGRVAGDRREHVAPAQQLLRVRLVLDAQLEGGAVPGRHFGEDVAEPVSDRVGVDRDRQLDRGRRRDGLARLGV